ncbi:MAG: YihY/virulence factor BrkB family protein [Myxococcales bacterium]|nr:YihY/virulence factor BrkB family protein [Myxococcales bacterium]
MELRALGHGLLNVLRTVVSVARFMIGRDASLLAAGLAFFAMISLAPFIVLAVAVGGMIFGQQAAQSELHARVAGEMGDKIADFVVSLAQNAADKHSLSIATIIGALLLLWSSTRLFMEVRRALHAMWQIPPPVEQGLRGALLDYLKARLFAAIGTVVFGALLLALLGSRVALDIVADLVESFPIGLGGVLEPLAAIVLVALLVMIIFKLLPARGPRGWPLWGGALATAALLVIGRSGVALYVSTGAIDTAYGAAGSAVVFLVWAYWSSLAFLFGARLAWALAHQVPLSEVSSPTTN